MFQSFMENYKLVWLYFVFTTDKIRLVVWKYMYFQSIVSHWEIKIEWHWIWIDQMEDKLHFQLNTVKSCTIISSYFFYYQKMYYIIYRKIDNTLVIAIFFQQLNRIKCTTFIEMKTDNLTIKNVLIGNRISWTFGFDILDFVDLKSIKKIIEKVINNLCVNENFFLLLQK